MRLEAEILFPNPDKKDLGAAALVAVGFSITTLDWTDDLGGPSVWIKARVDADIAEDELFDWVAGIVAPFDGDTIEAGLADPSQAA